MLHNANEPNRLSKKTITGVMLIWVMIVALIAGLWAHYFVTEAAADEGRPPDMLESHGAAA